MFSALLVVSLLAGQVGSVMESGDANWAAPSHGSSYLAMRLPRGTVVTICAVRCQTMTVNDYGPVLSTGDIADIALVKFAHICGWTVAHAKVMGECEVTVEYGGQAPTPPATDAVWWSWPGGRGPR